MSALPKPHYTPEEYLTRERTADTKSEYIAGEILAMSGASLAHNTISANLIIVIGRQLDGKPCRPFGGDMRVQAGLPGPFFYPDVLVVCGDPMLRPDQHLDTIQNPMVVIEVLSPSTEAYDRGEKFAHYRRIVSLQEYVLVSQDKPRVERYVRQGDDWLLTEFSGLEAILELPSIQCSLPLAKVYEDIRFAEPEAGDDTEA